MNLPELVFRIRGLYMLLALSAAMALKASLGGTTTLPYFIASMAVLAAVQAFRMYAAGYLWGRQAVAKPGADFLCTSGPYGRVRNPMYLGNFFIGIGLSIAISEWYAYALFVASYVFVYSIVIPYEERFLEKKFGKAYLRYKEATGRLVPRLKGYGKGAPIAPNYKEGILGEAHVLVFLALILSAIYFLFVR